MLDGKMIGWIKPRAGGRGRRWRYGSDCIRAADTAWTTRIPLNARADHKDEHAALELELRGLAG
jgi:hypothetical protein